MSVSTKEEFLNIDNRTFAIRESLCFMTSVAPGKKMYLARDVTNPEVSVVLKKVSEKELEISRWVTDHKVPNCIHLLGGDGEWAVLPYYRFGDLWCQLDTGAPTGYTEETVRALITDLATALVGLKQVGVIHHDISLENVLVSDDGKAILADFGLAVLEQDLARKTPQSLIQGKVNYVAPELLYLPDQYHDLHKADVWSLGICAAMLLTGQMPYNAVGDDAFIDLNTYGARVVLRDLDARRHHKLSEEAKLLIESMLQVRPEKRIALEDILQHPFVTGTKVPQGCWSRFRHWFLGLFSPP
jgi:serine/threonine protein kinase